MSSLKTITTKSFAALVATAIGTFGGFNYVNCGCILGACSNNELSISSTPISTVVDSYVATEAPIAADTEPQSTESQTLAPESCCKPLGRAAVLAGVEISGADSCELHHAAAPELDDVEG